MASTNLQAHYPWTTTTPYTQTKPLLVSAPMHTLASPALALAVSAAAGIGFIGPATSPAACVARLEDAEARLATDAAYADIRPDARAQYKLPLGMGFLLWDTDLGSAEQAVTRFRPAAAWLFAPRGEAEGADPIAELRRWSRALRAAAPGIRVWVQVGTVREATALASATVPAEERPDVLVLQGTEAGGHGRAVDGAPLSVLLPEAGDAVRASGTGVAVAAAGGVADGRGVLAALALGAQAVVMGTAFLASREADVPEGYRAAVLTAREGGTGTVRTLLYNHLRGVYGWPAAYSPRVLVNRSWVEAEREGVEFEEVKRRHDELRAKGGADSEEAWGREGRLGVYAGMGVGLVGEVRGAGEIVVAVREEARTLARGLVEELA
ncbi:uncharacterized protein K452DRAFT_279202 [Aplosporella prunicola CBS 121167]|uniref:Uncharacterized protein n=1 Tax=Aplosporella prunicola CBS 121167 TaxID=1176127 RepID=A0A6A6B0E7_9PEZI|nr:uncharacterized protein K452DRAFT_279202 [Aplosporella prunicola CBS 121167]KAF2137028.1 hypothetical protein K452DRAFT_279202 [Aplosporella prunicola CBS 121167]